MGAVDYVLKTPNLLSDLQLRIPVALENHKNRNVAQRLRPTVELPRSAGEIGLLAYSLD
jgi:hypothetical protein